MGHIDAADALWHDGLSPRGDDQFVVGLFICFTALQIPHHNFILFPVDFDYFIQSPDVYIILIQKFFFGHEKQFAAVLHYIA